MPKYKNFDELQLALRAGKEHIIGRVCLDTKRSVVTVSFAYLDDRDKMSFYSSLDRNSFHHLEAPYDFYANGRVDHLGDLFAYCDSYGSHRIDLEMMEVRVKTLRRVNKALDKVIGPYQSHADYIHAIGVAANVSSWTYSDETSRDVPCSSTGAVVERLLSKLYLTNKAA